MSEESSVRERKRQEEVKSPQASSSQLADKPWDHRLKEKTPTCWEQYGKYFWMLLLFESIILLVGIVAVLSMDSPIKPMRFQFPTARPLEGALAPNRILQNAKRLFEGELIGPESLVRLDGKIYTGTYDGKVVRIDDDKLMTTIARLGKEPCGPPEYEHTCGRPLGIHVSDYGTLYVIDAYLGLFEVNVTGEYKQLVPSSRLYDGYPIKFGNDVTRIPDGDFFFTDSDYKWQRRDFLYGLMETSPNGRLLQFNPVSQATSVTLLDLYSANGIILSPDNDFMLICESTANRILKYYIRGQKSGDKEIFVDNLPGFPDNIRASSSGGYWVGINFLPLRTGLAPILNFLAERPILRTHLMKIMKPHFLFQFLPKYGLVIELNKDGEIINSLHDPTGEVIDSVSEVLDTGNALYLGSFKSPFLAKLDYKSKSGKDKLIKS